VSWYALGHVDDAALLHRLTALVLQDRVTTAELLAHIAEVDARKLYVPAGYPSMFAYCVEELRLSEDAASKRIHAARAARQFPQLFSALAEGRLHLSAIWILAPHLTGTNVQELIEAATHRTKFDIEALLARRFSRLKPSASVRAVPSVPLGLMQHAPGHVDRDAEADEHAPGHVGDTAPLALEAQTLESPERYFLQATISKSTHEKLRHLQALLSHAIPSGDIAAVLDRAVDLAIAAIERRKLGVASHRVVARGVSHARRPSRYIPASIRRAVWERDKGQCTFEAAAGHRCTARRFLEFDHVQPFARSGKATVEGLRLRCREHNQYEAERSFGAQFMARKRTEARHARERAREEARARAKAAQEQAKAAKESLQDVVAGLRSLGCRVHEARRAAELTQNLGCATLEERMQAALRSLKRREPCRFHD